MAKRVCALCGRSGDMRAMLKAGKDYLCHDRNDCYRELLSHQHREGQSCN
jgi:hypothetical protein